MSPRASSRSASCRSVIHRPSFRQFSPPILRDGPRSRRRAISKSSNNIPVNALTPRRGFQPRRLRRAWIRRAWSRSAPSLPLFYEIGADLADHRVLVAGAAAATDPADDLAAFDKRNSARARDQRRIERANIAMAGLKGIEEQACFATVARRRAG